MSYGNHTTSYFYRTITYIYKFKILVKYACEMSLIKRMLLITENEMIVLIKLMCMYQSKKNEFNIVVTLHLMTLLSIFEHNGRHWLCCKLDKILINNYIIVTFTFKKNTLFRLDITTIARHTKINLHIPMKCNIYNRTRAIIMKCTDYLKK